MPRNPIFARPLLLARLINYLSSHGPAHTKEACEFLQISQSTFSRLIAQEPAILRIGRGPNTQYACHRTGGWGRSPIPLFTINAAGTAAQVAVIHPLAPQGLYLETQTKVLTTKVYPNLPYFLDDLRPSGFLGRLVPQLYPQLGLPPDIMLWSDDHCLTYLARYGWDQVGNYLVGEPSYEEYVKNPISGLDIIKDADRETQYPKLAELVLSQGIPGSSAGGEQPKFFSIRKTRKGVISFIVKFSPPTSDVIGQRIADLLICEHIAHQILRQHKIPAPESFLVRGGKRLFLEVSRFDRTPGGGRRGVISLRALDLEFVGQLRSWSDTAESLWQQKKITQKIYHTILWLEVFGKLIGNTDRHHGNISFFCDGEVVGELAPVYDMLPMMYAPQQNQLVDRLFTPSPPKPSELNVWKAARDAARAFWAAVQKEKAISMAFRKLTLAVKP